MTGRSTSPKFAEILGPDDEPALRQFLGQRIQQKMFLLSNMREARLDDHEHRRSGCYVGGPTTAVLFTADGNVPARRAYAALGFEAIGRYRLLLLGEPVRLKIGP